MAKRADPPPPRRRSRRGRLFALGAAGVAAGLVVVAAGLWLSRNAVGERLAMDYLRRRGVPASVRLTRLDAGGVAGSVAIGPASDPTLVVDRFEADFAPGAGLDGQAPQVRRLVLVRPRLSLRYDGKRLDFGSLQPLIDDALRAPPGGGPSPDVRVEDGRVRLATPYGRIEAEAAAELSAGRLVRADIRLPPTALQAPEGAVEGLAGTLALRPAGAEVLSVQARLSARSARSAGVEALALTGEADGVLPYRRGENDPFAGRAALHAVVSAAAVKGAGSGADRLRATLSTTGDLTTAGGLGFDGSGEAAAVASTATGRGVGLTAPSVRASASRVAIASGTIDAKGRIALAASSSEVRLSGERVRLSALAANASGGLRVAAGSIEGEADADISAHGGVDAPAASRLGARWAPGPYGDDLRPALSRALRAVTLEAPALRLVARDGAWRAVLAKPARVSAQGGGALVLAAQGGAPAAHSDGAAVAGAVRADLAGGGFPRLRVSVIDYRTLRGATDARFEGDLDGSAGPLREAAFTLAGRMHADAAGVRVTADGCAPLGFSRFIGDTGAPLATDAKGRACPLPGAPLLSFAGSRWTAAAALQDLAVAAPPAKIAIVGAEAIVRVEGGAGGRMAATAQVARATIRDTDAPRRFNPLTVSGPAKLVRDVWSADLAVALARPAQPLGALHLTQDQRTGAGGLTLDAPGLAFAPDRLQPAAVLPALMPLATQVQGKADVALTLGWKGEAITASVHVRTANLQAKTVAGLTKGIATDLTISSLDPLASPPGQVLTAERVEGVLPLTDLVATYRLGKDVVEVSGAHATLAGGRIALDPMRVGLLPDSTLTGVVRADGVQLGGLLDAVNLSRAVKIDAKIAGVIPFSLGPEGLRLTDGRLAATEPGRLTLQRAALTGVSATGGEAEVTPGSTAAPPLAPPPPIPPPQTSAVQDFAFQALENLAFSELSADVGSRPNGRVGVVFHIKGRHDPPKAAEARVGLVDLIRGKAFDKPIPLPKGTEVNLTLDSSLNLDDLLKAYTGLSAAPGSAQVQP